MAVSQELVWLISQIRNTPSAVERLRLLALGWRTLRGLSTADRIAVARELGFDGAERLVEQLARRGGASPSLLLRGLDSLKSADPDQISGLVRDLTDADQRAGRAGRLMDAAAGWLEEEIAVAEAAGRDAPPEGEFQDIEQAVIEAHTPPPPPPSPPLPPPEVVDVELQIDEGRERVSEIEVVVAHDRGTADEVQGEPTCDEGEQPEPPYAPGREEKVGAAGVEEPLVLAEERVVAPSAPDLESVTVALAAATRLGSRFRVLAESVDDLEGASVGQLDAVVEAFPFGWARRRAIEVLLRAGVPRALGDALELVSNLQRPSERMWALTTLATSRDLNRDERDAVIAAASSPSFRRRLRLRLSL